ncbi:RNA polymerase sigma factor [Rossellomorea marisflavi]|uniref:RNA polymerase sigma factor n=1 Tax=Rossellomorea marisflavi TaxID=189381 RepID=UPI00295E3742|nr:sigma-70 family RNA polymerase sigma factor [Rossellomorea marisflavi]
MTLLDEGYRKQKIREWYVEYNEAIFRYIVLMIGDREQAKDLTHDTFLKAFHRLEAFQGEMSDKNWLYRIARNATIDFIRKRKPLHYVTEMFTGMGGSTPEDIVEAGEEERMVYDAMNRLKRSYREVLLLRKFKGLSIRETADVLGWKESKVKTTLSRALQAMKAQLEKEGYHRE